MTPTIAESQFSAYPDHGCKSKQVRVSAALEDTIRVQHSIFISYRRDDSEGEAGRLYDDLVRAYGKNAVFMDVAGIAPGLDFRKAIDDNVAGCGVFLAVIGPQWAAITGPNGQGRLDDANDFVRLEVASALARNIAVIPVLVHEARMPHPDQLPDNIKDFAYRNSVEISHARWNSDVQLLIDALKQYVTTTPATEKQPVHAAVPVQLPPPVATEQPPSAPNSHLPLLIGAGVAVIVLAVVGFLLTNRHPKREIAADTPQGQQVSGQEQGAVLRGDWSNVDTRRGSDAITKLRIDGSGPGYSVEPIGQCPQGPCSWGVQTVTLSGGQAIGDWQPRNTPQEIKQRRTVDLILRPDGGRLDVTVKNTLSPDAGPPLKPTIFHYIFERQQP